jgi:hypothetical protein
VTRLGLKDDLLDAQALRALGAAPYEGSDVGEVLHAVASVRGTDLGSWHAAWTAQADRVLELADAELAAGRAESARRAVFRACTYDRTAGGMLMGTPVGPRLVASYRRQTESFRRGAALLPMPPELVAIPYEGTTLPGYFLRATDDPSPRRTVILVNGYDGTAEELYFWSGAAALARGYHVLMFDGPGQGSVLLEQGLVMRHDWEAVVTPAVDHLLQRPEVDGSQLVLIGLSLGGHLAPRAASYEHRLAACIADCGSFDMSTAATERIPGPLRDGLDDPGGIRGRALRGILGRVAASPTRGWAVRRGMMVHGVDSPADYVRALRDYTLAGHADKISCPTLVCNAEGDDISASAPQLVAALTCPHDFITFTAADGADDHCEVGARQLYHARTFGWLDDVLAAPQHGTHT